jgi:hypothetical protein
VFLLHCRTLDWVAQNTIKVNLLLKQREERYKIFYFQIMGPIRALKVQTYKERIIII